MSVKIIPFNVIMMTGCLYMVSNSSRMIIFRKGLEMFSTVFIRLSAQPRISAPVPKKKKTILTCFLNSVLSMALATFHLLCSVKTQPYTQLS